MFITFLSDFGLKDDFVGTCHGVIKRIAPDAQIIDITHGIPAQSVLQGALVLANTIGFMPVGVHLAIVDPERPGRMKAEWTPDGNHPSVEGHRRLGEVAFELPTGWAERRRASAGAR